MQIYYKLNFLTPEVDLEHSAELEGGHSLLQRGNFSSTKDHFFRSKSAQIAISALAHTHLDIPTSMGKFSPTM